MKKQDNFIDPIKEARKAFRKAAKKNDTPEKIMGYLVELGINKPNGELTRNYGGLT